MFDPKQVYFVTNRCIHGRLLIRPSTTVNAIIGGILARAVEQFEVELFAFTFASNHFHLLLRAEPERISAFMQFLGSNIAKEIGRLHEWQDKLWARRFSAEPVLDDDALVERLAYILAHGVKENLVSAVKDWPGLTSLPEVRYGRKRVFHWLDRTAMHHARLRGEKVSDGQFRVPYTLKVMPLPCWEEVPVTKQRQRVAELIETIDGEAKQQGAKRKVLGVRVVLAQEPHTQPQNVSRSPRPLAHAAKKNLLKAYAELYREFAAAFSIASEALRAGDALVAFPEYSFLPVLPCRWRATAPP